MKTGTWFAMCPGARAVEPSVLAKEIGFIDHEKPRVAGGELVVDVDDELTGVKAQLHVHLSKDAHVRTEAAELAKRLGRPDVADFDARYELSWSKKHADAVYDTALTVASDLKARCGAVIYNQDDGAFIDLT